MSRAYRRRSPWAGPVGALTLLASVLLLAALALAGAATIVWQLADLVTM